MKKFKIALIAIISLAVIYFGYNKFFAGSSESTSSDSTVVSIDSVAITPADSASVDSTIAAIDTIK